MQERSGLRGVFAATRKGDTGLLPLLARIKTRGHGQVLILGRGVGEFYEDQALIPAVLGKDWTIFVAPPAPTWEQNQRGLLQFSSLIQEDANPPRVGIFMAPPDFVSEHVFLPSKSGPYRACIYDLGLSKTPLSDMETLRKTLLRPYIQSPELMCIFSADAEAH
jgi:hypothetical protein